VKSAERQGSTAADFDAVVVGAGPAGASFALRLARLGHRVALLDRENFPREKVCGEGLMPHGLAALSELGLGDELLAAGQAFHGIRYALPDGTEAQASFPKGPDGATTGLGIRRSQLDDSIVRACHAEPKITLGLGDSVRGLERMPSGNFRVFSRTSSYAAPLVVAADGARSPMRAALDVKALIPRRKRFAIRAHFEHRPRADQRPPVEVFMAPDYELYMTPVSRTVTGVIMTLSSKSLSTIQGDIGHAIRQALLNSGRPWLMELAEAPALSRIQSVGPLGLRSKRWAGEGWLLLGDAAGALDPITGEGLSLALKGAKIAAEVCHQAIEARNISQCALAAYERRLWWARLELEIMTSLVLQLSHSQLLARRVIRNLARFPETFSKLLGVTAGTNHLTELTLRDHMRLAIGV
jgi:2-polyprenyl-6-methoxyphenol hydroxylase-like FAD-dependent oxidoreductase